MTKLHKKTKMRVTVVSIILFTLMLSPAFPGLQGQNRWALEKESGAIALQEMTPHADHIEMSGEQMAVVLRWSIKENGAFSCERSLVFPMLRTLPNDTHASLRHRTALDVLSLLSVNGRTLQNEEIKDLWLDGYMGVRSTFTAAGDSVEVARVFFPSVEKAFLGEIYTVTNISSRPWVLYVPSFTQSLSTLEEKNVDGPYNIYTRLQGAGTFVLNPGERISFEMLFGAKREREAEPLAALEDEFAERLAMVRDLDGSLVLDTPDEVLDREFRFAKLRASESICKTAGGYMHAPGGEAYYAAIWANDQAEYVNPFFPFLGYGKGNASALNAFLHFNRFVNPDYKPLPSSIIAEGLDIWDGAGDRGDAAMVAYGATRYLLARGDEGEARQLWPLVEWCLEYCHRKLNAQGVVLSDSDELEGRFPAGEANLCTSCLYYDALLSARMLCKELHLGTQKMHEYAQKAAALGRNIEKYFGAQVGGFETYRYYEGNTLLRSWICMPLIVGLKERVPGTIAALTSPALMTDDGLLTQEGSSTFWDRSTLYAIRGIFMAGDTQTAYDFIHHYCVRRLLGDHVPYPIEAWPEGSQRHLSAESGLFCRAITEGMFGIRPTSFSSFSLSPRLPQGWDRMALRHVKAFDAHFDIEVLRKARGLQIVISHHTGSEPQIFNVREGGTLTVKLP